MCVLKHFTRKRISGQDRHVFKKWILQYFMVVKFYLFSFSWFRVDCFTHIPPWWMLINPWSRQSRKNILARLKWESEFNCQKVFQGNKCVVNMWKPKMLENNHASKQSWLTDIWVYRTEDTYVTLYYLNIKFLIIKESLLNVKKDFNAYIL